MRVRAARVVTAMVFVVTNLAAGSVLAGQERRISASGAWVKLPSAGDTQAMAFANFENTTMYDVYVKSATADVAGKVELRDAGVAGDAAKKAVEFIAVPAGNWAYLESKGPYLLLLDLKRALKEGDTVTLTLTTEIGDSLQVRAVVKKE